MDTRNMKSSSSVVLVALLFGLVGQAMATGSFSNTCFKPDPKERMSIDILNSMLGSRFPTDNLAAGSLGKQVFRALQDTMDKSRAAAILGQYSVQQLLGWNTWTVAECTIEGLKKRKQTCEKFCPIKKSDDENPPESLIKVNRQEAYTKHNLGGYCWEVFGDMLKRCPYDQLDDEMGRTKLNKEWKASTSTRRIPILTKYFDIDKDTLKKLFEK